MPSLGDSALIFLLALLLFGPKKLPELARQLGKLMGEFRRASNEFRMQMEDELRASEQEEKQKKIAALEAATPVTTVSSPAAITDMTAELAAPATLPQETIADPMDSHPHMIRSDAPLTPEPVAIATSGGLSLMPPSTGLPVGRSMASSDLAPILDAIPSQADPEPTEAHGAVASSAAAAIPEAQLHG